MQLGYLRSQRNIENINKKSDERNRINMIGKNVSDERNKNGKNDEDISTDDIDITLNNNLIK